MNCLLFVTFCFRSNATLALVTSLMTVAGRIAWVATTTLHTQPQFPQLMKSFFTRGGNTTERLTLTFSFVKSTSSVSPLLNLTRWSFERIRNFSIRPFVRKQEHGYEHRCWIKSGRSLNNASPTIPPIAILGIKQLNFNPLQQAEN